MASGARTDTFRFLDLPGETRAMVYKRLPITRRHSTLSMPYTPNYKGSSILVLEGLPLAILRVSKMIHDEAFTLLKPKMYELLCRPPRIIIPAPDLFEIGVGFAKFLQIIREIFRIPCIKTLESGERVYYQPGMIYYTAGNIPLIITPSLTRWVQHAGLYFGRMQLHPILAHFAADDLYPPASTAGIQLLISQPGTGPTLCERCIHDHLPLKHLLSRFVTKNLSMALFNPKVHLLLLGSSVCTPGSQNELYDCKSEDLHKELSFACWWTTPMLSLQKDQGDIVELAAWEEDWEATPGEGVSGAPNDKKTTESLAYIDFVRRHSAADGA